MINNFSKGTFTVAFHLQLVKNLLLIVNTAGLFIYGAMRCIFFDFPVAVNDELTTICKLLAVCSVFAVTASLLILLADMIDFIILKKKEVVIPAPVKFISAALILVIVIASSCKRPAVSVGIKKDFNTGMSSSYSGMEPGKTFLVMNNEILHHTDIPLGESFMLVNDGVKGLEVKDGKVRVGCSLLITDQQNKILMQENDLFAGHDEFPEKEAKMLKCTVNTGAPMKWEEHYTVAVVFWDKNSNSKIENKVSIRCIDIP